MKKNITSVELAALLEEIKVLEGGKLSQIYHQGDEFIFQCHQNGKNYLRVLPGKWLCFITKKPQFTKPTSFCMQLRKYVGNATITSIEQHESQRIVVFTLQKKEAYHLILELFGKGNLILTDPEYKIITSFRRQHFKDRTVKAHQQYTFATQTNWKTVTLQELQRILKESTKESLVKSLATDLGLGGTYAEQGCTVAQQDKNLAPSLADPKKIYQALQQIRTQIKAPAGYTYDKEITPFILHQTQPSATYKTYNEAIATLNPNQKPSPYEKKILGLKKRIAEQQEATVALEQSIDLNTKKAEKIYEQYQPINKLITIVHAMQKDQEWSAISAALSKEKKIKNIDLKKKEIVLTL